MTNTTVVHIDQKEALSTLNNNLETTVFHAFCIKLVVRNNIDTFWYRSVSIPYLGIDTWYCHWNSDQKYQKNKINIKWK